MNTKLKLMHGIVLTVLLSAAIASCGGNQPPNVVLPEVEPTLASENAASAALGVQPRIVAKYFRINPHERDAEGGKSKELKLEAFYDGMKYKPNDSSFPGFENWDVLELPTWWSDSTRADWMRVNLNRDATVGILAAKRLSWMDSSWVEGLLPDKNTKTFKKSFAKGEIKFGSPGKAGTDKAYTVLFAEANGMATPAPILASNAPSGATLPVANETCPGWLDNLYSTPGPDGVMYKSWHPQIDPAYWCYFRHEHGSDPALVGLPGWALEYVAAKNNNQMEIHEGFKGIAIRDTEHGYGWYINVHSETHDLHRVCTQKHTVVILVTDLKKTYPDNLVAMLGYKGDFGSSQINNDIAGKHPLIQAAGTCAKQSDIDAAVQGEYFKRIRVKNAGDAEDRNNGYERWQGGLNPTLGLDVADWFDGGSEKGHAFPKFEIDIRNPSTTCSDLSCTTTITNDNSHGDERTIFVPNLTLKYNTPSVKLLDPDGDGTFYTDVYGTAVRQSSDPDAIKQYIKPGSNILGPDGGFETEDGWRGLYGERADAPRTELENALGATN
jgi:hypothetical protein